MVATINKKSSIHYIVMNIVKCEYDIELTVLKNELHK